MDGNIINVFVINESGIVIIMLKLDREIVFLYLFMVCCWDFFLFLCFICYVVKCKVVESLWIFVEICFWGKRFVLFIMYEILGCFV